MFRNGSLKAISFIIEGVSVASTRRRLLLDRVLLICAMIIVLIFRGTIFVRLKNNKMEDTLCGA